MLKLFFIILSLNLLAPNNLFATAIVEKNEETAAPKKDFTQKIVGTALNKDKELFYTEEDEIIIKDDHIVKINSTYKDKDSKLMVEMHSDFSKKPFFPDIEYIDHRKDVQFKISSSDDGVHISQNLKDAKEMKTKKLDFNPNMTNSMGLINYIRENIASLKKENKTFRYVIPALMDDYGMVLKYRENSDKDDSSVQFAFQIESFFIRNISGIKESVLIFDEKGRFIKSFHGVSNILDDSNHPVDIQITYTEPKTN